MVSRIKICVVLSALSSLSLHGAPLIEEKLDDFVHRVVPCEDHNDFRLFYNELIYKQQKEKQSADASVRAQQKGYTRYLQELAKNNLCSMQVRDPLIAKEIKPYLTAKSLDPLTQQKLSTFLFRYGALEEYFKQKATRANSFLVRARSYFTGVKNKIMSWFKRDSAKVSEKIA